MFAFVMMSEMNNTNQLRYWFLGWVFFTFFCFFVFVFVFDNRSNLCSLNLSLLLLSSNFNKLKTKHINTYWPRSDSWLFRRIQIPITLWRAFESHPGQSCLFFWIFSTKKVRKKNNNLRLRVDHHVGITYPTLCINAHF